MLKSVCLAAVLGMAATSVSAQAINTSRWQTGFGQGVSEAAIRNSGGATLRVDCPAGSLTVRPGVALTVRSSRNAPAAENVNAVVTVDGRAMPLVFARGEMAEGAVEYDYRAANAGAERSMGVMIRNLRRGRQVVVSVPSDQVTQTFSLTGAGEALRDCPRSS